MKISSKTKLGIVGSISAIVFGLVRLSFQRNQMENETGGIGDLISVGLYVYFSGALFCILIGAATCFISFKLLSPDTNYIEFTNDALVVVFIAIACTSIAFWLIKGGV